MSIMSIRSPYLAIFALVGLSLASFVIIILKFDPFVVGWFMKSLFFASLILFASGLGILTFKGLRIIKKK